MAVLMPLWLYCKDDSEIAQVNAIKTQMKDSDEIISLHDLQQFCDEHQRPVKFYSLARCIGKLHALKDTENRKELELQFEEIVIVTNVTLNVSGLVTVKFMNESAKAVDGMISNGKLTAGDILVIRQPTFKEDVLENEDVSLATCKRISIELGTRQNCPDVQLWQCRSNMYIDSFAEPYEYYYHISVHNVENIGSTNHVLINLLHIIKGKGCVLPLKEIVNCKPPNICIALVEFKELVCPLKKYKDHTEIQLSFKEVILYETCLPKLSTDFKAYFFDSVAEELQMALKMGHLECGDFIALCHPLLDRMTAAPLNISFLLDEGNTIVILKNQIKDTIRSTVSHYEINADQPVVRNSKRKSEDIACLNTEYDCVNINIDFFYLKNFSDKFDALVRIKDEIEKHGTVAKLNSFLPQQELYNCCKKNNNIILLYFLKVVSPMVSLNKRNKTVILGRELCLDCRKSVFIKVILYDEFALKFYLGVREKQIVRGDIISLVNPFVFLNHAFMFSVSEEPYQCELSSITSTQRLIIFKLKRNMNQKREACATSIYSKQNKSQLCCTLCLRKERISGDVNIEEIKAVTNNTKTATFVKENGNQKSKCYDYQNNNKNDLKKQPLIEEEYLMEESEIISTDTVMKRNRESNKSLKKHCPVTRIMKLQNDNNDFKEQSSEEDNMMDESQSILSTMDITDCIVNQNIESKNSFNEGCSVTSTLEPDNSSDNFSPQSSAITKITSESQTLQRLVSFSRESEIGEMEVIPIRVTKPCLCNELDFISGYCILSCHNLFVHSAIIWNEVNEPTCPKCRLELKLILCFELDVVTRSREHLSVWLYDKYAENFLGVTFEAFLNSDKDREIAKKSLSDKLLPTYQGEPFLNNYIWRLSDLSNFARGEILSVVA